MPVQFVFDYRSPYAFLASHRLPTLTANIDYLPIDILAVMREVKNQPSPACPPKARYAALDAGRWAQLYQVAMAPNGGLLGALKSGEFDGALLSRAAVAALQLGVFEAAHPALFQAVWAGNDDLLSAAGKADFLRRHGIDADIWRHADTAEVRDQLASNDAQAISRGVFGVPSFFVGDELFFGNDRLDFVAAALKAQGVSA